MNFQTFLQNPGKHETNIKPLEANDEKSIEKEDKILNKIDQESSDKKTSAMAEKKITEKKSAAS